MARAIGASDEAWGQQVIVDNRAGPMAIVACEILVAARPMATRLIDGQRRTNAINPALLQKVALRSIKAFAPVSLLGMAPNILVVPAALPSTL